MKGTLSLLGLYNFDSNIFSGMNYPKEFTENDKQTFIDNLLIETAENEILYPDATFIMTAIRAWSRKELPVWEKLYATTILKYNPIWNKDGTVTETEVIGRKGSEKIQEDKSGNGESTSERSSTASGNSATEEHDYTFGFNSDAASEQSRRTENSESSTTSGDTENANTKTSENTSRSGEHSEDETRTNTRRETGNIGITTTQQMIKEERDVALFNLFDVMIDSFKKRFCLSIY